MTDTSGQDESKPRNVIETVDGMTYDELVEHWERVASPYQAREIAALAFGEQLSPQGLDEDSQPEDAV